MDTRATTGHDAAGNGADCSGSDVLARSGEAVVISVTLPVALAERLLLDATRRRVSPSRILADSIERQYARQDGQIASPLIGPASER